MAHQFLPDTIGLADGTPVSARHYRPLGETARPQHYPVPGWVQMSDVMYHRPYVPRPYEPFLDIMYHI